MSFPLTDDVELNTSEVDNAFNSSDTSLVFPLIVFKLEEEPTKSFMIEYLLNIVFNVLISDSS